MEFAKGFRFAEKRMPRYYTLSIRTGIYDGVSRGRDAPYFNQEQPHAGIGQRIPILFVLQCPYPNYHLKKLPVWS
jgi:hypothetical protein